MSLPVRSVTPEFYVAAQLAPTDMGFKRWFLKYRIDGKEKHLALGSCPAVSPL
jgi:hypothetical protein